MAGAEQGQIRVEVVYALPEAQTVVAVRLPAGATVSEAVRRSGLADRHVEGSAKVGIFGRLVDVTTRLRDGDRVEIYRPLVADPKSVRRARAGRKR